MINTESTQLYKEEYSYIFSRKGRCVRGVFVVASIIEGQIFSLAKKYLESKGVTYKPEPRQEYDFSLNILRTNGVLAMEEIVAIQKFQTQRNIVIHSVFKGTMTRQEWDAQNKLVVDLGRPLVKMLDQKFTTENRV